MKYPKEEYPKVVLGYVHGPVRWEKNGGGEMMMFENKLFVNQPALQNGWQVTHLQKKSRFGFLIYKPWCFHIWITFKYQTPGEPGSESVFYWRVGLWRWDAGDGKFIGPGTWYGPGLHWD